ncbi:MAG: MATE family efflux transporter [Rhodobacteraceae bacterium]|jgi:MATE family multidrug resistance protein|uniref:Multidrug resistance protein, MATE family n=1 Tax=Salipiger profundus TaxID=1229727 RepID=A0A1U7D7V4_9RHOB|nr:MULTISPECIES: MATE family efflux transporter [Salipiger]APX24257.1 multidrug resistance protein, MATE family [Salipiger profundus]MAB07444.1 MATE family efflux transporter [Paracoccaceae bacterium]GFZ95588.1 MATE family efflux transporter [Salipiger profundus]SFB86069.1 multidrug resistance protein, MATE family [Salipiger profundus]
MTEIRTPITHARVLKIALPILLSNVTIPILGAVDTGVVGQIPQPEPIAAVGVGAIVISAVYWIFGFLRMGTVGLAAQAAGAGDRDEVAALLSRALLIGLAGGALLILLQPLIFAGAFAVSPASPEVEALAREYMRIRIWSAPAAIAIYGITGWLIAQERTRSVFALQLWMNGINVCLDLVFVLGLDRGVGGVATATFLAEYAGLAMGLWLCRKTLARGAARDIARIFDGARLMRMAAVNTDILIRSLLLQAVFVTFLLLGGRFGDETLAANQVLLQFLMITGYALDGFAFAAEALVGRAFGAGQLAHLRRGALLTSLWAVAVAVLMALGFLLLGPAMIDVMAADPAVRAEARLYLPWMVAAPVMQLGLTMFDGIFIGATRSRDMRNMMVLSSALYFAALPLLIGPLGNHGLWLAMHVSFVARGVTLALRYPALERAAAAHGATSGAGPLGRAA